MKSKKNKFANRVVTTVIIVELIITLVVLGTYVWQRTVIPASIINALSAFWGGELLLLTLRQILGSDAISKDKKESNDSEDNTI